MTRWAGAVAATHVGQAPEPEFKPLAVAEPGQRGRRLAGEARVVDVNYVHREGGQGPAGIHPDSGADDGDEGVARAGLAQRLEEGDGAVGVALRVVIEERGKGATPMCFARCFKVVAAERTARRIGLGKGAINNAEAAVQPAAGPVGECSNRDPHNSAHREDRRPASTRTPRWRLEA